eukprot:GFYU01004155.1.p3 GENE.GFYU01004155.1~~GFYU01004155.1.p3  ORF type:complete len:110 (-),score=29.51 GFYU01004155.1:828-1157(-)
MSLIKAPKSIAVALQYLAENKVVLDKIAEVTTVYSKKGPGHAGARYFIKEAYPFLRYHNAGVAFRYELAETTEPTLRVTTSSGSSSEISVGGKRSDEILERLKEANLSS